MGTQERPQRTPIFKAYRAQDPATIHVRGETFAVRKKLGARGYRWRPELSAWVKRRLNQKALEAEERWAAKNGWAFTLSAEAEPHADRRRTGTSRISPGSWSERRRPGSPFTGCPGTASGSSAGSTAATSQTSSGGASSASPRRPAFGAASSPILATSPESSLTSRPRAGLWIGAADWRPGH